MKPYTYTAKPSSFSSEKFKVILLCIALTVFTLPVGFYYTVYDSLDGSWVRGINMAIRDNLVFGRDIIFTYGPLGYLSTRNTQYIHNIYLLSADIFLCAGFFYVLYSYLSKDKGWFWILLVAIFYFKGAEFASSLFLLFIVFAVMNLKNNFANYFELVFCAVSGVVVFFVKVNYGLMSLPVLLFLAVLMAVVNRKSLAIFLGVVLAVFSIILLKVNIDIVDYIKYSIPMITCYNESMQIEIDPSQYSFVSFLLILVAFLAICAIRLIQLRREKRINVSTLASLGLLSLVFFLFYKNGFTRNDAHNDFFFFMMPLFMVFCLLLLDIGRNKKVMAFCILLVALADSNVALPHGCEGKGFIKNITYNYTLNYLKTIFSKQPDIMDTRGLALPDNTLNTIGKSTVDVLPIDIFTVQVNNLNYAPRPVIQSYSAYSKALDSLNARHFYKPNRPEFAMVWVWSLDNRYTAWDESMTKATLHLNYRYIDFISLSKDTFLANGHGNFLLLQSKHEAPKYPTFEKLFEKTVRFDDTVQIKFPANEAVYMTADVKYNIKGSLNKVFLNPAVLYVSLFYDSACSQYIYHRAVKPIIEGPVLINKTICHNADFVNFVTGNISKNADIRAFSFHSSSPSDLQPEIRLKFFRMTNYQLAEPVLTKQ
jgi:hypothetical protein